MATRSLTPPPGIIGISITRGASRRIPTCPRIVSSTRNAGSAGRLRQMRSISPATRMKNRQAGWEIVPSYDAKCLVAYLMSLDQSHRFEGSQIADRSGRSCGFARRGHGGKEMNGQPPENRPRQGMDYGETEEVQETHAAIVSGKSGAARRARTALALADRHLWPGGLFWRRLSRSLRGKFQRRRSRLPGRRAARCGQGQCRRRAEQAAELTPAEKGKKIYSANCATCHQANGLGVAGQYPPLAGSEYVERQHHAGSA